MKLSIIFPSNRPDAFFNMFLPSINQLSYLKKHMVITFIMVYQGAEWTYKKLEEAEKKMEAINENFISFEQPKIMAMCLSRDIGIRLKECDYFMQTDDDVIFRPGTKCYPYSSGQRFHQCIEYMEHFSKCGFVMCSGSLGGSVQKLEISSTKTGLFATQRGIIFRYIPNHDYYGATINGIGSMQDTIITYRLLENGFFPAKQFNNPTIHRTTLGKNAVLSNEQTGGSVLHNRKILEQNNLKYIRDRYDDPTWEHSKSKLPKKLKEILIANFGKIITKERIFKNDYK